MAAIPSSASSRVVFWNVCWQTYEALLADRGDEGPRLAYDRGTLEIMSPSQKHERLKLLIGRLIEAFTEELGIDITGSGSTTLKSQLKEKGLEPDASYYVQNERLIRDKEQIDPSTDPPPDLAIEVDVSSSSVNKLGIYSSLGIREVWSHDGNEVIVRRLQGSGEYVVVDRSGVFPQLPLEDLNRCLDERRTQSDTQLGSAFRAWVREKFAAP